MTGNGTPTSRRQQRGRELARAGGIRCEDGVWVVPSQTGKGSYNVTLDDSPRCTCLDYEAWGHKCKHILAVAYMLAGEIAPTEQATVEPPKKPTYKQNWPAYNVAKCEEKKRFVALLADLCSAVAQPEQTGKGRPRLPLSDMLFASAFKVYVGFSSRRFTSDLREAFVDGLVNSTPHFNSVSNYMANPELTDTLKSLITASSLPLKAVESDFAVDSSGFSTCRYVTWFNKKYGREVDNREWVKVHLMCGVNTKVVTAVDISGWAANDTTYFVPLVERTAAYFDLSEVSADKAYLSRKNLSAVESAGAMPFIPFKSNTTEPTEAGMWARMYHLFMYRREEYMEHYHKRSNIETAYSMIKGTFGSHLRSKSDVGQINEALCKVLCHNICVLVQAIHELGIEPIFCAEIQPAQKMG